MVAGTHHASFVAGRGALVIGVALLVCTLLIYLNQERLFQRTAKAGIGVVCLPTPPASIKFRRTPVALNGTFELIQGVETVHQLPTSPQGVWFVAHGCNHGAVDFWPKTPGCEYCVGLPEEVNITRELLARGYAVVAISSLDREESRCWGGTSPVIHTFNSSDVQAVNIILDILLPKLGLDKLPLYMLGASSGGVFVLDMALGNRVLAGVTSQIAAVPAEHITKYMAAVKAQKPDKQLYAPLPPIMFVHMPLDAMTAKEIEQNMGALQAEGVPHHEIQVLPAPLTPSLLHDTAQDEITLEQSEAIYKALKSKQMLNDKDLLVSNPRMSAWREALQEAKVPGVDKMRLEPDLSPISEIFNVLFAGHEIVSRTTTEMVNWFESWSH